MNMRVPLGAAASALWSLLLLAGLAGTPAVQAAEAPRSDGWQFEIDNDVLARERTDRWYTNGVRLTRSVLRPSAELDRPSTHVLALGKALLGASVKDESSMFGVHWMLGQNMYTPRDISRADPQPNDRPWAGWLYAGLAVDGTRKGGSLLGRRGDFYQQTELKLGVIGRPSGADGLQRLVHDKWTGSTVPAGWHWQVRRRVGVQLAHLRVMRVGDSESESERDRVGFHVGMSGHLGNLRNYASLQAGVSIGWLKGRNPVFVISNEGDLVIQDFGNRAALSRPVLFMNVSSTLVGSNRFIEGNTPYGRSNIELKRQVHAWQWGISWAFGADKQWRLVYAQTARTPEFSSPAVGADEGLQRWGTLSVNYVLH
jgi:lipid A 3-O-deacylase